MKDKKLIVHFTQLDNVIVSKILYQHESLFDRKSVNDYIHGTLNGYSIHTKGYHSIYEKDFYLLSYQDKDSNRLRCFSFDNKDRADEWLENINKLIEDINTPITTINSHEELYKFMKKNSLCLDVNNFNALFLLGDGEADTKYYSKEDIKKNFKVLIDVEGIYV